MKRSLDHAKTDGTARRLAFGVAALACAIAPARAQAQSVGRMIETDARDAGGDIAAVWLAPLHGTSRDWLAAAGTLAAGAAISPLDDDVDRFVVRHRDSPVFAGIRWFREGGPLFSGKYIVPAGAALYAVGLGTRNRDMRDGTIGCLAAYTGTSVVRNYVLYNLVSRRRPDSTRHHEIPVPPASEGDQYEIGFGPSDWGHHAFPGGHVANMVACASFLSHRLDAAWVAPLMYGVATAIGAGRMIDRRHWASDTFVGIVYGYASGKLVADRSLARRRRDRSAPMQLAAPTSTGIYVQPMEGRWVVGYGRIF